MVTPTYYVLFTFATLVTSIILFQGLDSTPIQIVTIVLGKRDRAFECHVVVLLTTTAAASGAV